MLDFANVRAFPNRLWVHLCIIGRLLCRHRHIKLMAFQRYQEFPLYALEPFNRFLSTHDVHRLHLVVAQELSAMLEIVFFLVAWLDSAAELIELVNDSVDCRIA